MEHSQAAGTPMANVNKNVNNGRNRGKGEAVEIALESTVTGTPMANVNKNVNNGRNRGKGEAVEIALESTVRRGNRGSWNDGVNRVAHCGACKFLGRKCTSACLFAPYFSSDGVGEARFGEVHKIFGAANFSRLLLKIEPERRQEAIQSICFEAQCRIVDRGSVQDHGSCCVPIVHEMEKQLQPQVDGLRRELQFVKNSVSQLRYQQQEKRRQHQQEILLQADVNGGNNNNRSNGNNNRCESLCKQACRLDLRNPNL